MQAVLLSGGMDSAALACLKKPEIAIFVDYGQVPARAERRASAEISKCLGLRFESISIDCSEIGLGELAAKTGTHLSPTPEWWPYRNQLIATIAAGRCLTLGASELMIGTVSDDIIHMDGSKELVSLMDGLFAMQEGGLRFTAPAQSISAQELIEISKIPPEVLAWTHSCFISDSPCLRCRGCLKNLRMLEFVGVR